MTTWRSEATASLEQRVSGLASVGWALQSPTLAGVEESPSGDAVPRELAALQACSQIGTQ